MLNRERGEASFRHLEERVGALPGVAAVSFAGSGPLTGSLLRSVFLEGGNDNDRTLISVNTVGPRYFEAMGIPLVRGRSLGEEDKPGGTKAVVVNETMAKKFWPNGGAVGKRFRFFGEDEPWAVSAGRVDVLRMVMGRGMTVVGIGLAVGMALAIGLSRLAASLLVGQPLGRGVVRGRGPPLVIVALLANFFPTRRAAGVDPTVALRY